MHPFLVIGGINSSLREKNGLIYSDFTCLLCIFVSPTFCKHSYSFSFCQKIYVSKLDGYLFWSKSKFSQGNMLYQFKSLKELFSLHFVEKENDFLICIRRYILHFMYLGTFCVCLQTTIFPQKHYS